jgi:hypothetical protein
MISSRDPRKNTMILVLTMQYMASDSSMSFLISPDDARKLLKDTGFRELIWEDKTPSALEWFNQIIKHSETTGPPPTIGIHTIVGLQ